MIKFIKKLIRLFFPRLYIFASIKKRDFLLKKLLLNNPKTLIYIHIGKCGGITLENALKNSSLIKSKFSGVHRIHVMKPPILKHFSYIIVVRNPIQRAISAFNWRYKLVVTDEKQKNRFVGEYEISKKYGTLNALCNQLYVDGKLNSFLSDEFQKIHHLKENISFYLKPLLDKISPSQLFAVFATETLDKDIANILNIKNEPSIHQNSKQMSNDKKVLSEKSYSNLKTYLADDYLYLSKLISMNTTSSIDKQLLLK
tara:strand:- start:400 stop:1167 length:768 start_codon:yes stop_codon:yes gene_type:complete